jgi:hypothetical protein
VWYDLQCRLDLWHRRKCAKRSNELAHIQKLPSHKKLQKSVEKTNNPPSNKTRSDDSQELEQKEHWEKFLPIDVSMSTTAVLKSWLAKARANIKHPLFANWTDHITTQRPLQMGNLRPKGFRQRSTFIAANTLLDRLNPKGPGM